SPGRVQCDLDHRREGGQEFYPPMLRWRIGIDSLPDDESNPVAPGMPLALYDDPANSQQCGNSLRRPHIRIQDESLRSARTRRGRCAAPRQNADRALRYSISPSFSYRWLPLFGARDGCALSHHLYDTDLCGTRSAPTRPFRPRGCFTSCSAHPAHRDHVHRGTFSWLVSIIMALSVSVDLFSM